MIQIQNVSHHFYQKKKKFLSLKNISFEIFENEIVSLIGESGSGKSTLAKILMRLINPTEGKVLLDGKEIHTFSRKDLGSKIQMIFQDPFSSLNPKMKLEEIIDEPLLIHRKEKKALELLKQVKLPSSYKDRYPHEISGGERQRVAIARALALNPKLLILDEALSSLDTPLQEELTKLLLELKKKHRFSALFISHDIQKAQRISSRMAVIHEGEIKELFKSEHLYDSSRSTHTKKLTQSILEPQQRLLSHLMRRSREPSSPEMRQVPE